MSNCVWPLASLRTEWESQTFWKSDFAMMKVIEEAVKNCRLSVKRTFTLADSCIPEKYLFRHQ